MRTDLTLSEALTIAKQAMAAARSIAAVQPTPSPAADEFREWLTGHPYSAVLDKAAPWHGYSPVNPSVERFLQWAAKMRGLPLPDGIVTFSSMTGDTEALVDALGQLVRRHGPDDVEREVNRYIALGQAMQDEKSAQFKAEQAASARFVSMVKDKPEGLLVAFLGHCGWWLLLNQDTDDVRDLRAEAGLSVPPKLTISGIPSLADRANVRSLVDYAMDIAGQTEKGLELASGDDALTGLTAVARAPWWIEGIESAIAIYGPDMRLDGRAAGQPIVDAQYKG